jgi:4-amino-4-deoxy-L-arabinose transferase-like glycosyltransferase
MQAQRPRLNSVPRLLLPPFPAALAVLALAFVLPGLAGHDPWKSHDALGIGIAWSMALAGDPIVPRVAGLPWLADPPFYHWFAAGFGRLFGAFMEFHAAARLASGAFMLAALWLIHAAARDGSLGEERSRVTGAGAVLLLLGCIGLLVHAHEALPELPALAALCGALAVLPHAARRPLPAGTLFGVALGFAFLSSLWIAPAALGVAVAIAHAACPEWRTRKGIAFLLVAAAAFALIAASWPAALYLRAPELFQQWWTINMRPYATPGANLRYFLVTVSWFAWPAWPLGLWAAWALRRRMADPRVLVPAAAVVLMFAGLAWWGPALDVNLIALLAPLALLASQGIPTLKRGAAAALDWFGVMTFAFFAGLVWLGYVAMLTGTPPRVAANFARAAPGFVAHFELAPLVVALLLTLGWLYLVLFSSPSPLRSVSRWAAGMVLLWGTFAMLWMPWADYQKSYRSVAFALAAKIPPGSGCIASRSLGIPQAAAFDYHAGIRTVAYDPEKPRACRLLLVQGSPAHEEGPGTGWIKLVDVGRPGDRAERHRLYRLK